jgi:menaquinone-dependent protoporphyrinogen oxidase
MRAVLVAYGSKMGGTAEIAQRVATTLNQHGVHVVLHDASDRFDLAPFGTFVVGSAIYAGRWRRPAARLVKRIATSHPNRPLWLFHSGPLGDEANMPRALPRGVRRNATECDLRDIATFGGRRTTGHHPGDWRNFNQVDAWAEKIASALTTGSRTSR